MRHLTGADGAKFGSALLRTSFEQKPQWLAFVAHLLLRPKQKQQNNAKNTGFWLSVWKNWCVEKEITDEIENYEQAEFNTFLKHFYAEVNNTKGEDYEPESLKVMMASFDRHLKNKGCTLSIVRDREFSSSKEVLEDKAK